jgi:hypothetical protein
MAHLALVNLAAKGSNKAALARMAAKEKMVALARRIAQALAVAKEKVVVLADLIAQDAASSILKNLDKPLEINFWAALCFFKAGGYTQVNSRICFGKACA